MELRALIKHKFRCGHVEKTEVYLGVERDIPVAEVDDRCFYCRVRDEDRERAKRLVEGD